MIGVCVFVKFGRQMNKIRRRRHLAVEFVVVVGDTHLLLLLNQIEDIGGRLQTLLAALVTSKKVRTGYLNTILDLLILKTTCGE